MNTQTRVPSHPARVQDRYDRMVRNAGGRSRFIRTRAGRAHVVEAGDGAPVVHLHGNNTSSLSHLMLLEHTTAVHSYLVDRPGFGLSDPSEFRRADLRQHAVGFVEDVLDGLGLESAVLVGASGGGIWSVWYALDRPARVRGVVMLGSVPLLPGARIPPDIRLMATPVLGQFLGRTVKPGRRMLLHLLSSMGEGDTIRRYPELLDSLVDAAHDPVARAANVAELRAILSPFGPRPAARIRPEALRRLQVPTLMIWGDHDPVVRVRDAQAVAELVPDARLEVLAAGHVPQLGRPARVAALIEEFTRSVSTLTRRSPPPGCGGRARPRRVRVRYPRSPTVR
ncbi:alpha/beta fold hydrolase [Rhodococcus sp. B50]|uniref:alpha/beta fold hydrolase n=1 Tax=Rhodococcus sp. B50 TaxID=2682847 RepID=UPI001BD6788C|nr:alpha/beta hydrolase [Rhodococcus sp. B50]MBS9372113.1 4,5:9,10-diseco-3-hydroxy-5,9,17-trioxoandrosta-1(10),2-diene-4-oate hydrolase [Rhodococcus sp. B50]